ncbi:MAG: hypothetical protein OXU20_19205 [Myxococcales bacterium]|nr:hypothetical protein [Myxococcales bacterium]MDD9971168.1 hypothetical protein [Myxococcales bacterium]
MGPSIGTRASLAPVCLIVILACGQSQIVGHACPEQGCPDLGQTLTLPPPDCYKQFPIPGFKVSGDTRLCWIYSLDSLASPWADAAESIYVTSLASVVGVPSHHLDVRLASQDVLNRTDYPDGLQAHDCGSLEAWRLSAPLLASGPLLANGGEASPWNFEDAPLVVDLRHRVMIELHYVGGYERDAGIDLTLTCQRDEPDIVTRTFAFEINQMEPLELLPRDRKSLCAACIFQEHVELRRLFRPTHLIEDYRVTYSGESLWDRTDPGPCKTVSHEPWRCEFDAPRPIAAYTPLHFQCDYLNDGDASVLIGSSGERCSLFGLYSSSDELGEHAACNPSPGSCPGE